MFLKLLNKLSSMSQRQLLLMSGVIGALMFGLLYFTLSSVTASKPVEETQPETKIATVKIVTAGLDIPAQVIIQENMLKLTDVPESMKPADSIVDISKVVGKISRVDILTGDMITEKKLFRNINQAGFIGMIPADCRAMSIGISDITGVSGFIKPGDYVDVMMVSENDSAIKSEIILQNVLLLAMGKEASKTDAGIIEGIATSVASGVASQVNSGTEKSSSTATLALHSDEMLKLAAAARKGTIYLLLRPFRPEEQLIEETNYVMQSESTPLFDTMNPIVSSIPASPVTEMPTPAFQPPPSPVVNAPTNISTPSAPRSIEIIQGDKVVSN